MTALTLDDTGLQDVVEQDDDLARELRELQAGLLAGQKWISPKYFYDERGSELFDEITRLPEYYPTAVEREIMETNIDEIADLVGPQASVIEFGAGSNYKIRFLLEHLRDPAVYVPVDVSRDFLLSAAEELARDVPDIEIIPVVADFTRPFDLPNPQLMPLRNIVFFPGSTIGNFAPDAALELLKVMHQEAGAGGGLLIGVDLRKDPEVIKRAYNDEAGVTAQFNLNMLRHLNRRFAADFDVSRFSHRAIYNALAGRIEMYLVSDGDQVVTVGDKKIEFEDGERLLTEHSWKFSLDGFARLAARAGFRVEKVWADPRDYFSVQYLVRD